MLRRIDTPCSLSSPSIWAGCSGTNPQSHFPPFVRASTPLWTRPAELQQLAEFMLSRLTVEILPVPRDDACPPVGRNARRLRPIPLIDLFDDVGWRVADDPAAPRAPPTHANHLLSLESKSFRTPATRSPRYRLSVQNHLL